MDTRVYSAYNLARGVLLNSRLTLADSGNQPLKLLDIVVSGMGMDPTTGLWLTPLHAIPAVPRVFPFDLVYLDKDYRVLETAEMGPGIEFPKFHAEVASALILPSDILGHTHTASGDRLIVCMATELEALLAASGAGPAQVALPELPDRKPVAPRAMTTGRAAAVIELVPENPPAAHASRIVPGFEHSIIAAVAKAADNPLVSEADRGLTPRVPHPISPAADAPEPPASLRAASFSPGPSIDISEAVFDRTRHVPAAIIEHHIDPEDLFSNWVVSPPPTPTPTPRLDPPSPPSAAPVPKAAPLPRNGKANGSKTAARSAEPAETPQAAPVATTQSAVQPKAKASPTASDKPPSKSKQNSQEKSKPAAASPLPTPQLPPATTFTAVPYGMWKVSMPTAVAPLVVPKPVPPTEASPARVPANKAKTAKLSSEPASPVPVEPPAKCAPQAKTEAIAQPPVHQPDPKAQTRYEEDSRPAATSLPAEFETAPKPLLTDPQTAQKHVPGDFVATLQEKLQRAQHTKLESAPAPSRTPEPAAASAAAATGDATSGSSTPAHAPVAKPNPTAPSKFLNRTAAQPSSESAKPASDLHHAPQARPEKPKAESTTATFRSRFKQWLNPVSAPSDRRRNGRRYVPGMVAHYFTGGAPKPHEVADISMTGMYLLTDDRWMPGTMIQMTLQKPCARGERKQSINVLSRIVRRGSDGVAAEFVMAETLSRVSHDIQPSQATDKFALARFL